MAERARLVEVVDAGALTTVQDLGRPGHAHLGVPRSGALDQSALRLANRLVGNREDAAALETTMTGLVVRLSRATTVAVTGAPCRVRVGGRDVGWGAAVSVPAGATLSLGMADLGLRSVLALAGGILAEPVLGSRSTDVLSGLGPAPLAPGDVLPLGRPQGLPPSVDVPARIEVGAELHLLTGPHDDWFTPASLARQDGARMRVGVASNRVGLRLEGPPLERIRSGELTSEPMVLGAVQVPPDGKPVVLLNDHACTGGYPVIGVVRRADLAICAQLRPGDTVTVRLVRPGPR